MRQRKKKYSVKLTPSIFLSKGLKVDLTQWTLDAVEAFGEEVRRKILEAASEAVTIAANEYGAYVSFPALMDEPSIDPEDVTPDPMLISFSLPLNGGDDDPAWQVSLRSVVDDEIDSHANNTGWREQASNLLRLRDGFYGLGAAIDDALTANGVIPEAAERAIGLERAHRKLAALNLETHNQQKEVEWLRKENNELKQDALKNRAIISDDTRLFANYDATVTQLRKEIAALKEGAK